MTYTLAHTDLIDRLSYDPTSGSFTWKHSGARAGSFNDQGYWRIKIKGKAYRAHRLAFFYMIGDWPAHEIDHIDGNRSNNAWSNLREATRAENEWNKAARGKCNAKGVRCIRGRYDARIRVKGLRVFLGTFDTIEDAAAAYTKAANDHHRQFARTV